ncbi:polyprenyl synthetase family protein [Streptomyces sp. NBC_00442]|uniref:polyprenyl synthetase family protein n=1 Tax=Streptomyces sp. NBC_00442 TaxID=2903651 RepID=UPI002E1E60F5
MSTLPEALRRVATYQLGLPVASRAPAAAVAGGKGVRPALALACAVAGGGCETDAVAAAVAVELVHNFTLLHDDIMDGDRTRRHRPAAWVEFGVPATVLAGDALLMLALRVLTHTGSLAAVALLVESLQQLVHGQSADTSFEQCGLITMDDYLDMAAGKTGALTSSACSLGAVLAQASPGVVQALGRFGRHLGVAFQCVDDVLGIWGDTARTGKPVGADLLARKKTLPVLAALSRDRATAAPIARLYGVPGRLSPGQVQELTRKIERAGGRAAAESEAARQVEEALRCLEREDIPPSARMALGTLAAQAVHRDH